MVMGMKDTSYEERVETNLQRKLNLVSRPEANNDDAMQEESDGDQENDKDYTAKIRYKKKETVLVELPTYILNSPEVCSMLDRINTTSRKAVGVVYAILKTGKMDGKQVYISQCKISRPT